MPFLKGTNRGCRFQDLTGREFGEIKVIAFDKIGDDGGSRWWCRCSCGAELSMRASNLKAKGGSRSCGCRSFRPCRRGRCRQTCHGKSGTAEYMVWEAVLQRCLDKNCDCYHRYGGRGITVCDRWLDFETFLADMGHRPSPDHSIERIDNSCGYEPKNCRWATRKEQARNRRTNRFLEHDGQRMTLIEWAEKTGMKRATIERRIDVLGWSVGKALSSPPHKHSTRNH